MSYGTRTLAWKRYMRARRRNYFEITFNWTKYRDISSDKPIECFQYCLAILDLLSV